MSEPRIGRVLVASLHQAIADVLPTRLEFYENWLTCPGLREGTIGLAPLSAVLGFLRTRGRGVRSITARAGEYAADWTVSDMSAFERRVIRALPAALRTARRCRTARAARAIDVSRVARDRPAAARHGLGRSAGVAVLRGARGVGAAALRFLCLGDRARPRSFLTPRRCGGQRVPRVERGKGLPVEVEVRGATASEPAAAA